MNAAQTAEALDMMFGSPLDVISQCLRSMLSAAPGNVLYAADFANIEGRVLAWLADEKWKLQAFRDYDTILGTDAKGKPIRKGPDLYLVTAAGILGKTIGEVTEEERQGSGKVPELACGFQGGVGAFQNMAKIYGVKYTDDRANAIKEAWREKHPRIRSYWGDVEAAALDAVMHPGQKVKAGPAGREVAYRINGSFLWCRLPSGRVLCYPYPKLKAKETPWGEMRDAVHYMAVNSTTNKWEETDTYGGKLVENVTQAVARDLLAQAMLRVEAAGYPIVLHVHDEIVAEVPEGTGDLKTYEALCAEVPSWAAGLPIATAGWTGRRYRKA